MKLETAIRTNDRVVWDAPQFEGSYRKPKYVGTQRLSGVVIKHSYGEKRGQHTFTIKLDDGSTKRVKGRNLYPNLVTHEPDPNSPDRRVHNDE